MRPAGRDVLGAPAATALVSLMRWVAAARLIVMAAGLISVSAGLYTMWRGRRLEGLMLGAAGVAAAVTAQVVIGYVSWRAYATAERDSGRVVGPSSD